MDHNDESMSLVIVGASVIDGVAQNPLVGQSIWIERGRIRAIDKHDALGSLSGAQVIDAHGKYVIPGLMDANVHLLVDTRLENLARHEGRYDELIAEAAQVALKNGVTTVFDSWGPRKPLMSVRDRINAGELPGSRIFCAGNIIGLDGPFSEDFWPNALEVASGAFIQRTNALWAENVGPILTWMAPEQVAQEVRAYIGRGVDFIKYASSEHRLDATTFLQFSPRVQAVMVEEAHRAGITAQAHTMSVEALRTAIEAGCDLIQHGNITGPFPIPETTLELFVKRNTACAVLAWTKRQVEWMMKVASPSVRALMSTLSTNDMNLIRSGATLLLSTDGGVMAPEVNSDPIARKVALGLDADGENLMKLGDGHFLWFKAMEEKGMAPMEMVKAATRNIAVAYKKDSELGTLEQGKIADMLILDSDPLAAAENYRSIHMILKNGLIVNRESLPLNPILTRAAAFPSEEELAYTRYANSGRLPLCC
jgi:imidazolonepropionase-like amidohydrolase